MEAIPRSLDIFKYLLVGLSNGSIVEFDVASGKRETIMHSHHDGEVWGLAAVEGENIFFTSGDDNKIFMFDVLKRKRIQQGEVNLNPSRNYFLDEDDPQEERKEELP